MVYSRAAQAVYTCLAAASFVACATHSVQRLCLSSAAVTTAQPTAAAVVIQH